MVYIYVKNKKNLRITLDNTSGRCNSNTEDFKEVRWKVVSNWTVFQKKQKMKLFLSVFITITLQNNEVSL